MATLRIVLIICIPPPLVFQSLISLFVFSFSLCQLLDWGKGGVLLARKFIRCTPPGEFFFWIVFLLSPRALLRQYWHSLTHSDSLEINSWSFYNQPLCVVVLSGIPRHGWWLSPPCPCFLLIKPNVLPPGCFQTISSTFQILPISIAM